MPSNISNNKQIVIQIFSITYFEAFELFSFVVSCLFIKLLSANIVSPTIDKLAQKQDNILS